MAENFEASEDTAHRYMKLASNSARVRNLGDISLRKALEAISKEDKAASFDACGFLLFRRANWQRRRGMKR